jgi:hypothetical protein
MRKLRQILKLKLVREYPHRRIAESVGVSPGSVGSVISRAKAKGLRKWKSVEPLAESELEPSVSTWVRHRSPMKILLKGVQEVDRVQSHPREASAHRCA